MNRSAFFAAVRSSLFGGKLSQSQVSGMDAILDEAQRRGTRIEWLSYMLATGFHETAQKMQPVRETLASTDEKAILILDRSYAAGKLSWVKTPYWRKDAAGKSWLGRGLVQLTHKDNYERMSDVTGVDLIADPGMAMEMAVAVKIMFEGMERGSFTGKKLSDYLTSSKTDYYSARRIINGIESAAKVATYAKQFEAAIRAAGYMPVAIQPRPTIPAAEYNDAIRVIMRDKKPTTPAPVVIDRKSGRADCLTALINALVALLKGSKA